MSELRTVREWKRRSDFKILHFFRDELEFVNHEGKIRVNGYHKTRRNLYKRGILVFHNQIRGGFHCLSEYGLRLFELIQADIDVDLLPGFISLDKTPDFNKNRFNLKKGHK